MQQQQILEQGQSFGQNMMAGAYGTTSVLDTFGTIRPDAANLAAINNQIQSLQSQLQSLAPNSAQYNNVVSQISALTQQRSNLQNLGNNFNFNPGFGN